MTTHTLPDGRTVTIRPVRPEDCGGEARFLEDLSPEARHNRFQRLSNEEIHAVAHSYTRIDHRRQMAFVCTANEDGVERIVGDARYFIHPDGESCEFGIVVADGWRHTGVAQLLMQALMRDARSRGVRTMGSLVLASNRDMLEFGAALGFEAETIPLEPARVRITRPL